jgi:hypothetical protein
MTQKDYEVEAKTGMKALVKGANAFFEEYDKKAVTAQIVNHMSQEYTVRCYAP